MKRTGNRLAIFGAIILAVVGVGFYFSVVRPVTSPASAPFYIHKGLDLEGGVHAVLQAQGHPSPTVMAQTLQRITYRVNGLGVSEPTIQQQGKNEIAVDLPGVKNQQQAIKIIGETGQLVFKDASGVILTGADLKTATAQFGQNNQPVVLLQFNPAGTAAFAAATQRDLNKTIGIYLDGKLLQNPTVQSAILNGSAQITGYSSLQAAQRVAVLLSSGALPVPLKIVEVKTISATLGSASVLASERAILIAIILIVLFMVAAYRLAGVLADVALVIYMYLLLAILIAIHAVLTLPGVAGIVLSAGIAVDANVIIFARIKDELRAGKTFRAAIDAGFKNAIRAILDSNVSTIIAAFVLYEMGSGEVRGFALTLGLGVLASMVTAIWVTKYLLKLVEDAKFVQNTKVFLG